MESTPIQRYWLTHNKSDEIEKFPLKLDYCHFDDSNL
jgi:hypothetical protein